jgi:hypothetical protein
MDTQTFRSSAEHWIDVVDAQARRAIAAWRTGGESFGHAARERWDRAFAESSPQLSAETRRNASHLRDVVARRYACGVDAAAQGAERAVAAVVHAAHAAVARD